MSRLKIICPDGISHHAQVMLDGEPMLNVTKAVIDLTVGDVAVVTLTCDMVEVDLDMEAVERIFDGAS